MAIKNMISPKYSLSISNLIALQVTFLCRAEKRLENIQQILNIILCKILHRTLLFKNLSCFEYKIIQFVSTTKINTCKIIDTNFFLPKLFDD